MDLILLRHNFDMSDITYFGDITRDTLDHSDAISYATLAIPGINEVVVRQISTSNGEPKWMLDHRLKSLDAYQKKVLPTW